MVGDLRKRTKLLGSCIFADFVKDKKSITDFDLENVKFNSLVEQKLNGACSIHSFIDIEPIERIWNKLEFQNNFRVCQIQWLMRHEEDTFGNLLFRDDTLGPFVTTIVHQTLIKPFPTPYNATKNTR